MFTKYKPVLQVTVYVTRSQYSKSYYLESTDILECHNDTNGNDFIPLESKPLKESTLRQLASALVKEKTSYFRCKSSVPKNLIYFDCKPSANQLIWFVKGKRTYLHFNKRLNIPSGEADTPNLIFHLDKRELRVFAVKTSRPSMNTKLYQAPFHNVNGEGRVCIGNAKFELKSSYFDDVMNTYEKVFWKTEFSEVHSQKGKLDLNQFWKHLVTAKEPFPYNQLTPINKTIIELTK
jgi:PRTRC genetic system protein B